LFKHPEGWIQFTLISPNINDFVGIFIGKAFAVGFARSGLRLQNDGMSDENPSKLDLMLLHTAADLLCDGLVSCRQKTGRPGALQHLMG